MNYCCIERFVRQSREMIVNQSPGRSATRYRLNNKYMRINTGGTKIQGAQINMIISTE